MRKTSIDELLEDVKETYQTISSYKKISRPKVKSILEHLRSCLEYAAQDINEKLSVPKKRFYFPYGETLKKLEEATQKNLPLLKVERPDIFDEITKLHNFENDNAWLKVFCDLTNNTKHKDALDVRSDQEVVNSILVSAGGMNFLQIGGQSSNIVCTGNRVNGMLMDDFIVNNDNVEITKRGDIPINFRITKDRKILIGENQMDLLPFLDTCITNIDSFIKILYEKL